jgi:hypothetical protein
LRLASLGNLKRAADLKTDDDEKMTGRNAFERTLTPSGYKSPKGSDRAVICIRKWTKNEERLGTLPGGSACVSAIATTPQTKMKIHRSPHRLFDANVR